MLRSVLAVAMAFAALSGAARATTLFDSGTPPVAPGANCLCSDQWLAGELQFNSSVDIDTIEAQVFGTDDLFVVVYADDGSAAGHPGTELFSDSVTVNAPEDAPEFVGVSNIGLALGPGKYWFAFESILGSNTFGGGVYSGAQKQTAWEITRPSDGWSDPQTAAYGLLITGEGRHGLSVGVVPEPTAWALMVVGLGFVGAGLRRQRTPSTAS